MKAIQLMICLTDDLGIKSITFSYNDTELPSNADTLGKIAMTVLKSISLNQDSLAVQDLLNELDIAVSKND